MIVVHRRNKIKEKLFDQKSVKVADLVDEFHVSEETIRRDLNELAKEGLIKKNYGGAILVEELNRVSQTVPPVQQRQFQFYEEKDAIGHMAATFVQNEQIVTIDAGSTTWFVAKHLRSLQGLSIISNGINIVEECSKNESSSIYMLGGQLKRNSMSVFGSQTQLELQNYNADIVFLGTSGISLTQGFTSSDWYEAEVKKMMVASGQKKVVLADHSKLEKPGLLSFCPFEAVDMLITSERADPESLKIIADRGVEVVVCPLEGPKQEMKETGR
ncbi:MAG TPA: DeoR/GlpR family DNA-binding transcription regulator [Bacillales bacterium]|nr:DeoR/GlpR family DNA-binding transcription regulator [Bacillales bacterium]